MEAARTGRFITLEGGEGAGKSTQARRVAERLVAAGRTVVRTREPGGSPGAEAIRGLLLGQGPFAPLTEALLHFAARHEHVTGTINPALTRGEWVVADRFADSTFAYQVFGQGLPTTSFDLLYSLTINDLRPDLTILLDVDPGVGLARVASRGQADHYERAGEAFHARVRAGFQAILARDPARCVSVDASGSLEAVAESVWAAVRTRFGLPA